ncbi:glycine betaine/L-proline ABC transporter ATP-binding protein [Chitinispirillales bacterium ANBcel5]|uniref:quaternary amine ABC transporter ATP-binding protein n=1 Tax=Cellulosispirillum alkaliphilum TaxID=3039283 RepID=UPI002A52DF7D|nr:glycine betaine/L-proline ABC transporter ATP-binding protein [Chitinispirillales bacterium ANBcel5]
MTEPKITIRNCSKIFGPNPNKALKMLQNGSSREELKNTGHTVGVYDVSFDIYPGETIVVMGLSGSGKSTLLRCLNRLYEPTAGKVFIDKTEVTALDKEQLRDFRRKKFGMVFQRFGLLPHRTVMANVEFGLEIQQIDPRQRQTRARHAIELVGLKGWENSYPDELSGGMQQRVGLARALAVEPDILLMDEAFSALDPLIRTDMQNELLSLESTVHKTIVFITHDLDEALKLGDRIVLMKDGEIIQIGTPEEILVRPETRYVKRFVENVDLTKVVTASDIMVRPRPVVGLKDGPMTALHCMKECGESFVFVVSKDQKFHGFVSAESASMAVDEGKKDLYSIIENDPQQRVAPDCAARDLIKIIVEMKYPLAVVDEKGKLKGKVMHGSILAGLANWGGEE